MSVQRFVSWARVIGRGLTIAALLGALACLLVAAPASARRSVPPSFFGANWDGEIAFSAPPSVQDDQFGRMAAAGVETVRTSFMWAQAQASAGAPFDFSSTDPIVQMASAHGLGVEPVVILAPDWARQDPQYPFSPPVSAYRYADYLTALIGRYGPSGTFWTEHPGLPRLPIRTWQIWNEPHLPFQWSIPQGKDYAPGYAHLLKIAYRAVKRADPGATVVLAGLANDSPRYLQHLYKAGIGGSFDVAAIHPYTRQARGVVTLVRRFRAVMARNHDSGKRVWVTELGLPASEGKAHSSSALQTTDKGMAKFLSGSYALLARNRAALHIARVYWYTWASAYNGDIFRFSGLFRYPGGDSVFAQPAYSSYLSSARHYEGCTKTTTGACG